MDFLIRLGNALGGFAAYMLIAGMFVCALAQRMTTPQGQQTPLERVAEKKVSPWIFYPLVILATVGLLALGVAAQVGQYGRF